MLWLRWILCGTFAVYGVESSRADVLLYDFLQNNTTSYTGSGYNYNAVPFRDNMEKLAQRFVTQANGSVITEIKLNLWTWPYNPGTFTVKIFSDNSNSVGTLVATVGTRDLSSIPTAIPGTLTPTVFSALNIRLAASTSYWIVVENSSGVVGSNMKWGLGGLGANAFVSNPTMAAKFNYYQTPQWGNLPGLSALGMQVAATPAPSGPIVPSVSTPPTASNIAYGQSLSAASLSSGLATVPGTVLSVPGTFTWSNPSSTPALGTSQQTYIFTPTDTVKYQATSGTVNVTVAKATPVISAAPAATTITFGQTLGSSALSGGVAAGGIAGSFAWTTPTTAPNAGTATYSVTFTPTSTENYNAATVAVSVTVNKATPTVSIVPTATGISYGQTLAYSELNGGVASVGGSFRFTSPSTRPSTGTASHSVTFTPTSNGNYNTVTTAVSVTVTKATPIIWVPPTASSIIYGQTLAASTLSGGEIAGGVAGSFVFTMPATAPNAGTVDQPVTFNPTDTANYDVGSTMASVMVNPLLITGLFVANDKTYDGTTVAEVSQRLLVAALGSDDVSLTGGTAAFDTADVGTNKTVTLTGATLSGTAADNYILNSVSMTTAAIRPVTLDSTSITLNPPDLTYDGNPKGYTATAAGVSGFIYSYVGVSPTVYAESSTPPTNAGTYTVMAYSTDNNYHGDKSVNFAIAKATPTISVVPTASAITYGQTLASSTLSGGVVAVGVAGTFGFTTPSTAPNVGIRSQGVTFTPTDSDNYNTVTTTVNVTVNKATLAGVTWPSASAISHGQALSEATLTGGSVNGTFAFTTPFMVPNAGPSQSFNVIFIPTDADNYSTVIAPVSVTVEKVTPTIVTVPTTTPITYGQTLADSTLMGGAGSVSGWFEWVNADTVPNAGTVAQDFVTAQTFVFIPDDTTNYVSVTGSVEVEVIQAVTTVSLDNLSANYDGTAKAVFVTTTPSGIPVNVTYNGQSLLPVDAGSYEVLVTINDPNYTGWKSMILTIAPKTVTVSAAANTKEYLADDPNFNYVCSGLLGSDVLTGSLSRESGEDVGTYAITVGSLNAGNNYTIDYVGAVFTITAAVLPDPAWTVFPPASLEYDGTAKTHMALAGGAGPSLYSSTVFSYLYEGQDGTSYAATATAPTQVGDYRLTTTASGNYAGTRQTDFSITPKSLTVSGLTAVSRAYDGTSQATLTGTPAYVGLAEGEVFTVLGTASATFANAQAGTSKVVSVTGLEAPTVNYQVMQPSLLADITKATLVPVLSGATSVVFDGNSHALTASTTPVTSVSVTYDGSTMPPTQVGIYTVVATVLDDNYEGSASSSLRIQAKSVTSWAEEFGLSWADAAPSADPDGDGLNNATEFAFGTNPTIGGGGKTCEMLPVDSGTLGVTFLRRISSAEATYQARVFTDLSAGFSSGTLLTPLRSADQTGVPPGYERVEVQAPTAGERGFIQIKATVP